ncbi:MAG TPA: hypothetical protein PLM29_05670 [Deltaproteobacteria bacterium]|nr:hypothetical protein [Deltaproteobacteria bacterium]
MDQFRRRVILLSLIKALRDKGSWCGETHIQKAMFALQKVTDTPVDYDFILYKHGPFSFDLRDEITELRADGYLTIEINPYPYGPNLSLSDMGNRFYQQCHEAIREYDSDLEFISGKLAAKGVAALERLSTALYVCKEEGILDSEQCAVRVNEVKPHVPVNLARDAASDVEQMLAEYSRVRGRELTL